MINVTQPYLPPLEEFQEYLKKIWDSKWLTNNGKFHEEFEQKLSEYLGVKYVSLFANGTLALITALKVLNIKGEVITTPYSFVATAHSLLWNNIKPVFVDIENDYCNIDPEKIESAITPQTTAILPVHVYGNSCQTEKVQKIAKKNNLKVIYDAAHSFGVKQNGQSILNFGDLSILSFHATKIFTTFEGGAIVSHDAETKQKIDQLKNFGFMDEVTVIGTGINAKMSEFQSAFGLLSLKYIDKAIEKRKLISETYQSALANIKGISFLKSMKDVKHNYSYFPIFINQSEYGISRDKIYEKLKQNNIYCRRYFYPLISEFPAYNGLSSSPRENLPVAYKKAEQVLCLPIYPDLEIEQVQYICKIINKFSE
ncbi:MAG: DegT/DnrJ/EryC1/StrS family aminotransferase [Bacteroidales bacterium]|jgi:dTDP-4-amino-4,6-dideoxygalactose transaminase